MEKKVSIVIPMYNSALTIEECLESISAMSYPKQCFEVIIVNDGSTDDSARLVNEKIKGLKNFKLLDLGKNQGKIMAREAGVKAAKNSLVAFTDTDCKVDKDWLKELTNSGSNQAIGVTYNNPKRGEIDLFFHLVRSKYYHWPKKTEEINWKNFEKMPKGTENFLCEKKLFLECSPKNKERGVNDDTLIMSNILKKGKKFFINPKANVTHLERNSLIAVFKQWKLRGMTSWNYFIEEKKNKPKAFALAIIAWVVAVAITIHNPFWLLWIALAVIILDFLSSLLFIERINQIFSFWKVGLFAKKGFALGFLRKEKAFFGILALSWLLVLAFKAFAFY